MMPSRKREVLHSHVCGVKNLGKEFEITNGLPDGNAKLMCVCDAGEISSRLLPQMSQAQQILILAEHNSCQDGRPRQEFVISELFGAVFRSGDHDDAAQSKSRGDRRWKWWSM
jgi:hypothetical protein